MKRVAIEPTLLNQSNGAYTNPMFSIVKVKAPRYQFTPNPDHTAASSNKQATVQ